MSSRAATADPDKVNGDLPQDLREVFVELGAASAPILDLDRSQQDAWVSGVLSAWRSDIAVADPDATDRRFISWCRAEATDVTSVVADVAIALLSENPPPADAIGCWEVSRGASLDGSTSVVVEFALPDESRHCVLVEIAGDEMIDIRLGPSAEDLLPTDDEMEELGLQLQIVPADVHASVDRIVEFWRSSASSKGPWNDELLLNQIVAAARMRSIRPDAQLPLFRQAPAGDIVLHEGMTPEEIAEADEWTAATLRSAAERHRGEPSPDPRGPDLVEPVGAPLHAGPDDLSPAEREALTFLEWADWLGVVLGALDAGPGAAATPALMVDWINRCPHVSTAVDRRDRPRVEHALAIAVAWWKDLGLLVDDQLAPLDLWVLPRAACARWGHSFDG